jgi:hypothetical protein
MSKYWSPSDKGFYDDEIHGDDKPGDVVEITDEEHASLLEAQSRGRIIDTGKDGKPIARDLNDKELSVGRKRARDQLLTETDWLVNRHRDEIDSDITTTLSSDQYRSLQEWRVALRNLTEHPDFPRVQFPTRPEGI